MICGKNYSASHLTLFFKFDLQLENWGVDLELLKAKEVKRVFRAWVEDWEKECMKDKDAVAEIWLLEKCKGLAFFDPEERITYTIVEKKLEWYKSSKRNGIDGGWWQQVMKTRLNPL